MTPTVSEAQIFHSMVNDCTAPLIAEDAAGNIITFNKAAEQMFGYRAGELIGLPMTTLIPDERAHEEAQVQTMLSQNQPVCDLTTVRVHKDGHLMVVALTASPIFDSSRNRIGTSHVLR